LKRLRIVCRDSKLSLLQAQVVQQKIQTLFLDYTVEIIGKKSKGDIEAKANLAILEDTDIFTKFIYNELATNKADIAVHSLKDLSTHHFFNENSAFAVVDREDVRDVAIFNNTIEEKIKQGEKIIIGTCSPRREKMALEFLKKALPQLNNPIAIETKIIRGNVETRLQKLMSQNFDGIILATAGINRLLNSQHKLLLQALLANKKIMILPLIECVPAPSQGAIVAEANKNNHEATTIIEAINNNLLYDEVATEKKVAANYGSGCSQKFGVATIKTNYANYCYAAGFTKDDVPFQNWYNLPQQQFNKSEIFSTTDYMKDFFSYKWNLASTTIRYNNIFIANYKAINDSNKQSLYDNNDIQKTIFVSGNKTWFALAKLGVWVTATADGLGVENLIEFIKMPLVQLNKNELCILTHKEAAERWAEKGLNACYNYTLISKNNETIKNALEKAKVIFWTSYAQFDNYKKYVQPNTVHSCLSGETANLIMRHQIKPIIFPTIRAFEQWRNTI
jgi:hydroxymethylbilane synthase